MLNATAELGQQPHGWCYSGRGCKYRRSGEGWEILGNPVKLRI